MTCDHVREQLWVLGVDDLGMLEPHLSECPDCAALAAAIREEHEALAADLHAFADQAPFDEAFARARHTEPAPVAPERWTMFGLGLHGWATAAAAVAALALGSYTVSPSLRSASPSIVETPLTVEGDCADLVALEVAAMTGTLPDAEVACLEERVSADDDAVRALRLLSVNAFSAADLDAWEAYAVQLAEADPKDPDVAYKLALHFSKQGVEGAEDVVRYADQAHQARKAWTGDVYVNRVSNLYKLKAAAALSLYEESRAPDARSRAALAARDWLEYGRAADRDTKTAEELCLTLADADYCGSD